MRIVTYAFKDGTDFCMRDNLLAGLERIVGVERWGWVRLYRMELVGNSHEEADYRELECIGALTHLVAPSSEA